MSRELKIMQCKWLRHHCNHFQSNASMIQCLPLATITTMPKINAVPTFQMTFWSNTLLSSLKQNQWLRHKFLLRIAEHGQVGDDITPGIEKAGLVSDKYHTVGDGAGTWMPRLCKISNVPPSGMQPCI